MKTSYVIENQRLVPNESSIKSDLTVFNEYNLTNENEFIESFSLPKSIFAFDDLAPLTPRYETILSPVLGNTLILALSTIQTVPASTAVEDRLETHLFVLGEQELLWFNQLPDSSVLSILSNEHFQMIPSKESILLSFILLFSEHFKLELENQKNAIQCLKQQAPRASNVTLISQVATVEQDLVILEHTIDVQDIAVRHLLENSLFLSSVKNDKLVWDVKENNRIIKQTIHMYRDLLDTVSNLYSDIISNNLNQTMRYLNSLSIIIATSALIASLWGMNTGGLPFKDQPLGTWVMIGIAITAGIVMYLFLKKKDSFKD